MSQAGQASRVVRLVAIAWLIAASYNVRTLAGVSPAVWLKTSASWLGMWSLLTHTAGVLLAPLGAVLVWRERESGLFVMAVLAGNALLYWTFYVILLKSTYWPVLLTLTLAVVSLGMLGQLAIRSIRGGAGGSR